MQSKDFAGRAPDDLVLVGKPRQSSTLTTAIDFNSEEVKILEQVELSTCVEFKNTPSNTWINVDGLENVYDVADLIQSFDLDKIIAAEILNTGGRPKTMEFGDNLLFSLKMISFNEKEKSIEFEHLSFVLTGNNLLSFQEASGDVFEPIRSRLSDPKKRIRQKGIDYLAYTMLDVVVDNYNIVINRIGENIEKLEDEMYLEVQQGSLEKINQYKRELNFLKKEIAPARDVLTGLIKSESSLISKKTLVHFKDVQSNLFQALESIDSFRELLTDLINLYHTTTASKLNDIMKFLTVFSVLFIPLTFIAGIYGTNFTNMPEKDLEYGYFGMWVVMLIIAVIMLLIFKRKKWL